VSGLLDIVVYFLGEDKDVVHVDDDPSFTGFKYEEVIHHRLKGGRRVAESEEHYSGFEESFVGFEGRFPLISMTLLYPHLMSNLVKYLVPLSLSMTSEIRGSG